MKIILEDTKSYLLRFDKGESVLDGLTAFAGERSITAAVFTAIGACESVTLAYYDLTEKKYIDHELEEMEIVSVTGNIGEMDNAPIIHAHGVFSDRDLKTSGGHLKKLIVSATCEVSLTIREGKLTRGFDQETGLNLLR